jgi:hypothetical protein
VSDTRRVDGLFLAAAAALLVTALGPWPASTANAAFAVADVLVLALACGAAMQAARRFERENPSRLPWRLVSAGLGGFWLGETLEGAYTVRGRESPFPGPADVFFLVAYPLILIALFLFLRAYRASGLTDLGAMAAPVTALAVAAVGLPLLIPVLRAPLPVAERLVSVAYGLFDLAALVPLLLLLRLTWRFRGGRVWPVWASLLFGFLLTFVGDVLVAYWQIVLGEHAEAAAETLDLASSAVFTMSYLAIARGALHQRALLRG